MAKAVEIATTMKSTASVFRYRLFRETLNKGLNKREFYFFSFLFQRFVGTTPGSSNITALLESLTRQITLIYQEDLKVSEVRYFHQLLRNTLNAN